MNSPLPSLSFENAVPVKIEYQSSGKEWDNGVPRVAERSGTILSDNSPKVGEHADSEE